MTLQEFVFDLPLYTKVKMSENPDILNDLCRYDMRIDGYNPHKGIDSTYGLYDRLDPDYLFGHGIKQVQFRCKRHDDPLFVLIQYDKSQDFIEKVGQYPSVADIHIAQVKKYRKVLGESYIRDFTKAIGLAANGVGTGSFVYLRRIFEHLVFEVSRQAISSGEFSENDFAIAKMDKKLKMLENHLPEVLKDNKVLYGVLSKGIHELPEEDCLKYFSVVREIIELILDEFEFARQKEEKIKAAKNRLTAVAGEINNK